MDTSQQLKNMSSPFHKVMSDATAAIAPALAVVPWLDSLDVITRIIAALAATAAAVYSIYSKAKRNSKVDASREEYKAELIEAVRQTPKEG